MKILLVEDDPILRETYYDKFTLEKFEVITASNGKDGIIQAAKEKPDFILLDIMMPEMDGVTAFEHLKKMPETKNIPVALLTVVPEGVPESLRHDPKLLDQAVGYFRKDKFTPDQIVSEVKKHLNL